MNDKYLIISVPSGVEDGSLVIAARLDVDVIRMRVSNGVKIMSEYDGISSISYYDDIEAYEHDEKFLNYIESIGVADRDFDDEGWVVSRENPDSILNSVRLYCREFTVNQNGNVWWSVTPKYGTPMESVALLPKDIDTIIDLCK